MQDLYRILAFLFCLAVTGFAHGQSVVDIPTRPGVTQRLLLIKPDKAMATVILFAGGHGGLGIFSNGSFKWGDGNFLIRSRQFFAERNLNVVIVDTPSDRQSLAGFRQTPEHLADIRAVIAWARTQDRGPVWLVGTSRGTQSAAFIATELRPPEGPDGLVLTSTILKDDKGRAVPAMPLDRLAIPTLVVHHQQDGCAHCLHADLAPLKDKLAHLPRHELLTIQGGANRGDPCDAYAYHGYNGLEKEVVGQIADWIQASPK
jgi:predicted alpha/beta-hydrolase family hydrolase